MISSWYANRRFTEIDYNMPMGSLFVSEWPNYISKLIYKKKIVTSNGGFYLILYRFYTV